MSNSSSDQSSARTGLAGLRPSSIAAGIIAITFACGAAALWLFPRALPTVALQQRVTRDVVLARADSFFRVHGLAPADARTAVRFQGNDSLRTFVELAGGGHDSLNALVSGRDVTPFVWSVRAFAPGDPREARVDFAPDGRIVGFARTLAEADKRPTVSTDSGQRLAEQALAGWISHPSNRWKLVTSSYETRKTSQRVDRTYTFERVDRTVGGAPIRADVVVAGDTPTKVRSYVEIPETFLRRYSEMRSANDLLTLIDVIGILAIAIAGIVALSRSARARLVRWRAAMVVGGVIGALSFAAALNEMPGSWYPVDPATSPATFQSLAALGATVTALFTILLVGFTLAAAEAATRRAFPQHLDWWKLWTYRGTKEVAARVGAGYAAATIAFAYVAIFYLITRKLLGWWVPGELLDDPNQIASPLPWISGIAASANAGVWEEALFRALPLSLFSLWVGQRPKRRSWMAGGVIATALVFGFAHSSYESWPAYSRGVEIFLDACFWGVLFINFGLIVTVVAHFAYDLVQFGLFTAMGSAPEYRISAAIIVVALLAPALAVAWKWLRQRELAAAPEDARFAAWRPGIVLAPVSAPVPMHVRTITPRARKLAFGAALLGLIVAVARPPRPVLGPPFTAERARVGVVADSILRIRGADPQSWKRLISTGNDTLAAWPRFLRERALVARAQELATTYAAPTWWVVRYVHTTGAAAQRTEEWRIRLWPDGRPLDARHVIPDSARRDSADPANVRRIALASLTSAGVYMPTLQESDFKETALPNRRDVTVMYTDTAVKLPMGASARAWVQVAGDEPLVVRRGVELPETFLRADKARQTSRALIAALSGLLFVGIIVVGAVVVTRRREILLTNGTLDRQQTLTLFGVLALLAVLDRINSLPSILFPYDTSQPWGNFVGSTTLGFVTPVIGALVLLGIWLAVDAVRRRVGIPMILGSAAPSVSNDMLIVGVGLGALLSALMRLDALIPGRDMPRPPSTLLNLAIPVLGGVAAIPMNALMEVAIVALPVLVVLGITQRSAMRALAGAVLVALLTTVVVSLSPPGESGFTGARVIGGLVLLIALAWALYSAGGIGAWSWIVAALVYHGFGDLRRAVYAPTWQEHGAGLLSVVAICGLVALIARHTRLASPPVPAELSAVTVREAMMIG